MPFDKSMLFQTGKLPFQLTKLSLLNIILEDYTNLFHFLKPQAKTLKDLELGREFPNFIIEFVFGEMIKLHTLSLTEIPKSFQTFAACLYRAIAPMQNY